jgi:DNA-binding NtrC family response regulator
MTRVVILGAGKGGRALLEMFAGDPTVSILGVADLNPWAPGIEFARRLNVPVTTEVRELVSDARADLIIDVTGSADVHRLIHELKAPTAEVIGGIGARFMWDLLAERKRSEVPLHILESTDLAVTGDEGLVAAKERRTRAFERQAVVRFLIESGGNISVAAKTARMTRRNFHRLLLKHEINPRKFRVETAQSQ